MQPNSASNSPPLDPARAAESRGYQVTITNIVCVVVATVLVVLRIYVRLALVRKRFWEDLAIAAAMATSIAMSVLNQLAVRYGTGRHIETMSAWERTEFLKVGVAVSQLYSFCHFFLKLSILLQFARVSVLPLDRRLFQGAIAINCLGYAVFIVLRAVRCLPYESQWDPKVPGARCLFHSTWFVVASQIWNMVMDFVILLGPLLVLRHSSAPLRQRVLIGIVLAFGGAACIISIVRMQTLLPSASSADSTWDKVPSVIYAIIEINIGISCAAVVTLRPLYRSLREAIWGPPPRDSAFTSILNTPWRWRPSRRVGDDFDLITGGNERAKTSGSESGDGNVELGTANGPPREEGLAGQHPLPPAAGDEPQSQGAKGE